MLLPTDFYHRLLAGVTFCAPDQILSTLPDSENVSIQMDVSCVIYCPTSTYINIYTFTYRAMYFTIRSTDILKYMILQLVK